MNARLAYDLAGGGSTWEDGCRFDEVMWMQTEKFEVLNVKCGGCAGTIRDGLLCIVGVKDVTVAIQDGEVTVNGEALDRAALADKLRQLGYPEAA